MVTNIPCLWFQHLILKKNTESTERPKTSFPKRIAENADSILNKIMATQE